jgi:hypothetical protein
LFVTILVSDKKIISALDSRMADIFISKFRLRPVRLRELQFCITMLRGGGLYLAPVAARQSAH